MGETAQSLATAHKALRFELPGLQLAVRSPTAKARVQGLQRMAEWLLGQLSWAVQPNTARGEDPRVLWLGPREQLVYSESLSAEELFAHVSSQLPAAGCFATDISDSLVTFDLTGARAAEILSMHCPLDFHSPALGIGRCAQSAFGPMPILVEARAAQDGQSMHSGEGGTRAQSERSVLAGQSAGSFSYRVHIDRSLARYWAEWLRSCAAS